MEKRIIGADGKEYCTPACCGGPPRSAAFLADLRFVEVAPNVAKLEEALKAGAFPKLEDHRKVIPNRKTYYWSMRPGQYVDKRTGSLLTKKTKKMVDLSVTAIPKVTPKTEIVIRQEIEVDESISMFTGTPEDWFERVKGLIVGVQNDIFRENLFASNLLETSPLVFDLLLKDFKAGGWTEIGPGRFLAKNKFLERVSIVKNQEHRANRINVRLVSKFKAEFGNINCKIPEIDIVALDQPTLLADYEIIVLDMPAT
jgi:hypothetical protein